MQAKWYMFIVFTMLTSVMHGADFAVCDEEQVPLSFDSLFPISPTKKVIDTCMHAWDDLAALQTERGSDEYSALLMDAFLGKMVRLQSSVHKMVILSKSELKIDDFFYMLSLFERLELAWSDAMLHDEHRVLAAQLLRSAKSSVQALITD